MEVRRKGKGFDRTSLPFPWDDVDLFIKKFVTCEGHFWIVFNYNFQLLTHLRNEQILKFHYYMLKYLQHMEEAVCMEITPPTQCKAVTLPRQRRVVTPPRPRHKNRKRWSSIRMFVGPFIEGKRE